MASQEGGGWQKSPGRDKSFAEFLRTGIDSSWEELRSGIEKNPEGLKRQLGAAAGLLEELSAVVKLPAERFQRESEALTASVARENFVVRQLVRPIHKVYFTHARTLTRAAMLRAAVSLLLDGPGELEARHDPVNGGAFEYTKLSRGFELKVPPDREGKEVALQVGG